MGHVTHTNESCHKHIHEACHTHIYRSYYTRRSTNDATQRGCVTRRNESFICHAYKRVIHKFVPWLIHAWHACCAPACVCFTTHSQVYGNLIHLHMPQLVQMCRSELIHIPIHHDTFVRICQDYCIWKRDLKSDKIRGNQTFSLCASKLFHYGVTKTQFIIYKDCRAHVWEYLQGKRKREQKSHLQDIDSDDDVPRECVCVCVSVSVCLCLCARTREWL